MKYIQPKLLSETNSEVEEEVKFETICKLAKNVNILIVIGAIWVSTTAMALLEPCLPIWLMETIHPEVLIIN